MLNDFLFKATLAVTKIVRCDLLIALHLPLDLIRDCCVMQMMLRDRQEGTTHHASGGIGNDFVGNLNTIPKATTAQDILESIKESADCMDNLIKQWDPGLPDRGGPLIEAIGWAREYV